MKRRWRFTDQQRAELWARFKAGETLAEIAAALGRHPGTVQSLVESVGGCAPRVGARARWALRAEERETIARQVEAGAGVRAMARLLARAPSTISRELARNGGRAHYRAFAADGRARRQAARPKPCRLAQCRRLRRLVAARLARDWSPAQIAGWLRRTYPGVSELHVSAETIYRSLFIQARGLLKRELTAHLRSRRAHRRAQVAARQPTRRGRLADMLSIRERPAAAGDRAVPGHWEGDLLLGAGQSAVATLVERQSRYVQLVRVPNKETVAVVDALIRAVPRLPGQLMATLTWDQGKELAQHRRFTVATDVAVYFCDPRSPWQRGSNENTNGLLRQYFPRGTDLRPYTQPQLDAIARRLNTRPRQTLDFRTPAEVLQDAVALTG